jgi:hypothetical protein
LKRYATSFESFISSNRYKAGELDPLTFDEALKEIMDGAEIRKEIYKGTEQARS